MITAMCAFNARYRRVGLCCWLDLRNTSLDRDIRLGDIVASSPHNGQCGLYDFRAARFS